MKFNEYDKIKTPDLSNRQYIPIYNNNINNKRIRSYYIFSFTFSLILIILFLYYIRNTKTIKVTLSRKSIDLDKNEKYFLIKLKSILEVDELFENEMMSKHTTFKLGGPARYFAKPKSINKIIQVIKLCKEYSIDYFILGNGSNLLVSDKGYDGLIINIHESNFSNLEQIKVNDTIYKINVGGGILMRTLAQKLCLLSLSGLEDIIDIPGTIGGGIIMNADAGGKGFIRDSLEKVKVITPDGDIKELTKDECELGIKGSLLKNKKYMVIEATFTLKKDDKLIIQKRMANHTSQRYARQPMYFPSAGCFFVWVKPKFGSLYERYKESNLIGYKVGDAMVYTHNIAFIVNLGNAKSSDVYEIVTHIENIMNKKYQIEIRREVVVLGSFS